MWTRFLSPIRRRIGPEGIEPRKRSAFWRALLTGEKIVISRALVHFERLERPPGPIDARMRAAIALTARARAPFEEPGLHIVWQARHAAVWSWDGSRLAGLGAKADAWLVPEPVLDAAPAQDGFMLIDRRDGHEAQIWQGGALAASRFWARRPEPAEIERFRRAAYGAPDVEADASGAGPALADVQLAAARLRPVHAAVAAVLLIGAPLLHSAGSHARLVMERDAARSALAAFSQGSADDFGALERFRTQSAQLGVYRQALEQINPLAPAADLAEAAEVLAARIVMLRIEPGRVSARLEARGELDPAGLAQALEARASLSNVRLSRSAQSRAWEVEAELAAPGAEAGS